ncbi:TPA: hypothetical protein U0279_002000 [Listeria monocytogenes]|nr:hypothetical protein [Listeria monocytogenes]
MNEINHTSERANTEKRTEKQIIMQKILNWFVFSLLLASIGAAIGISQKKKRTRHFFKLNQIVSSQA